MKRYSCILFDLDGTLTYSHPGIYASIRYALSRLGYPEPDEKSLRKCVGPPLTYAFSEIFGLPEERVPLAVAAYRERYSAVGWRENWPPARTWGCLQTSAGCLPFFPDGSGFRLATAPCGGRFFRARKGAPAGPRPEILPAAARGRKGISAGRKRAAQKSGTLPKDEKAFRLFPAFFVIF